MAHIPRIAWTEALQAGDTLRLDDERAHHLLRVLKRQPGDPLILFQEATEFDCQILTTSKSSLEINVGAARTVHSESPLHTVLVQSLSRGDKMDFTVQKAVELGVSAIQPVSSQRGGVQLDDKRMQKKLSHWQAIAQSATEQSGRTRVPRILPSAKLDSWLSQQQGVQGFVLDPLADPLPQQRPAAQTPIHLLIGPEGGLSELEIEAARRAGLSPCRLGPRVLRTETAGLAALSAIQLLWGDLA